MTDGWSMPGHVGHPRLDAGGDDDLVEVGEIIDLGAPAEVHLDAGEVKTPAVVADRLGEVLLARDPLGDRELAADVVARLEELDPVPALGQRDRGRETGWARARRRRRAWCGGSGRGRGASRGRRAG